MFNKKLKINLLSTNWELLKSNLSVNSVPTKDEYLYLEGSYFEVVNVVHSLDKKHSIFVIVKNISEKA